VIEGKTGHTRERARLGGPAYLDQIRIKLMVTWDSRESLRNWRR
jgi:hypothetical protein